MRKELISYLTVGILFGYWMGIYSEQIGIGILLGAILSVLIAIDKQINT